MQQEREGRVLKSLFFNNLPTDPAEPDLGDRGGDPRAVIKDIPGEDQVSFWSVKPQLIGSLLNPLK